MDLETRLALNRINQDFYRFRAQEFSATRQRPWRGWHRMMEILEAEAGHPAPLSVLDVGCGNGRFARFLQEYYPCPYTYAGLDSSPEALEHARVGLAGMASVRLLQHDVVTCGKERIVPAELDDPFSLISVFGVLHHVPSYERRRDLLIALGDRLRPQGVLAISIWQFGRFERFRKKLLPWDVFSQKTGLAIDPTQLEPGDHILSWGGVPAAYRYCHFIDDDEASRLVSSLSLAPIAVLHADGPSENLNRYYLLRR
ncbi:MAG: class I SAM-dependent methyltransferase, partial [Acidobacteriota bacterium]